MTVSGAACHMGTSADETTVAIPQSFPVSCVLTKSDLSDMSTVHRSSGLVFGDERVVDFFACVSRLLLRSRAARSNPELTALGFFLRGGALRERLAAIGEEPARLRAPQGVICHFPPANVPVIFVYSWALSALAGNANLIRLSSRGGALTDILVDVLADALGHAAPVIADTQRLLRYGHDDAITALLSAVCDLRVVWGGDDAVSRIRQHPLAPHARDVTFPDRISFAVISAEGWLRAAPDRQEQVVRRFHADSYHYDQAACASPLTVHWVGEPDRAERARNGFTLALAGLVAERGPQLDATTAIDKYSRVYGLGLTGEAAQVRFFGNSLTILDMSAPGKMLRSWSGPGVFAFSTIPALHSLVPMIDRRHQTLTHFGFSSSEIADFAAALGSRGVDRVVPVGEALLFDTVWDGYDLLREFSRVITVR